jgi:16S rRNA (uracil1498-N3)-methyltransferase
MRLHRFYIEEKIGEQKGIIISDKELIHQLLNVFRFKVGDKVILFDGSGFEYEAEIILISKKEEELNRLTYEAKRIDTLRNEIVNQIFNKKPKRTYKRNLEVGFKKTRIYARKK